MHGINLATQIGSALTGVTYVLDEPSIGLHPDDIDKVIVLLKNLRDLGNTGVCLLRTSSVCLRKTVSSTTQATI